MVTDASNIPLKKLKDIDNQIYKNILESPSFDNYKAISGKSKSSRHKQSKTNFKKHDMEGKGVKIIIPSNKIDIYTKF